MSEKIADALQSVLRDVTTSPRQLKPGGWKMVAIHLETIRKVELVLRDYKKDIDAQSNERRS